MPLPILGVSVLARAGEQVLLVRRGHSPRRGLWAFPGGKVMVGERLVDAARREVMEETGVAVDDLRQIDTAEIIDRDPTGMVTAHYVIVVFAGEADAGAVTAGSDAAEARWVPRAEAGRLSLTADTARILRASSQRLPPTRSDGTR